MSFIGNLVLFPVMK